MFLVLFYLVFKDFENALLTVLIFFDLNHDIPMTTEGIDIDVSSYRWKNHPPLTRTFFFKDNGIPGGLNFENPEKCHWDKERCLRIRKFQEVLSFGN